MSTTTAPANGRERAHWGVTLWGVGVYCRLSSSLQSIGYWRLLSGSRWPSWCQLADCSGRITSSTGGHTGRGPGSGVYVNVSPVAYIMPSFRTRDTGT